MRICILLPGSHFCLFLFSYKILCKVSIMLLDFPVLITLNMLSHFVYFPTSHEFHIFFTSGGLSPNPDQTHVSDCNLQSFFLFFLLLPYTSLPYFLISCSLLPYQTHVSLEVTNCCFLFSVIRPLWTVWFPDWSDKPPG